MRRLKEAVLHQPHARAKGPVEIVPATFGLNDRLFLDRREANANARLPNGEVWNSVDTGCRTVGEIVSVLELLLEWVPLDEAIRMVRNNRIREMKARDGLRTVAELVDEFAIA